jgi:hypothetical protein
MKISKVIETLQQIQTKFGDIAVTGGAMTDDVPLSHICVTEKEGMEIWPNDPNGLSNDPDYQVEIDGVFFH